MNRLFLIGLLLFAAACKKEVSTTTPVSGDPARGKQIVMQYGCTSCHIIPGVDGPRGEVGPSLEHVAIRQVLGGSLPNNPQNMTQYLQNPQMANPQNVMPNLGIKPEEARDIAAFLYTLR